MTTKLTYAFMPVLFVCTALVACSGSKEEAPPPEASAAEPAAAEASAASSTSLDGSKFDVTMVKNDKPSESTISFGSGPAGAGPGEFISSLCATYDFQPSPYTTTKEEDGSETFKIVATSTTLDLVMTWEGTIRGDDVEGKITVIKKDGTPEDGYTFTGKRSGS